MSFEFNGRYYPIEFESRVIVSSNVVYILLTNTQIRKLWLVKHSGDYYIKDTQRLIPLDWVRWDLYSKGDTYKMNAIKSTLMPNYSGTSLYGPVLYGKDFGSGNENASVWELYKMFFPLESVVTYQPDLSYTKHDFTDTNTTEYEFMYVDKIIKHSHDIQMLL